MQENPPMPARADTLPAMASSTEAATRSRRLHTVKNVQQNVKEARQQALAKQQRIEELAKPLNAVSEKLARLDRESINVEAAGERRIESLQDALEKKIEKLKTETAEKIEQTKKDTAAKLEELQKSQQGSEEALLLEYAQAVLQFSLGGSNADLATVLGVSQKTAKELIASSTADLEKAGIAVTRSAVSESVGSKPATSDDAASDDRESGNDTTESPALASA